MSAPAYPLLVVDNTMSDGRKSLAVTDPPLATKILTVFALSGRRFRRLQRWTVVGETPMIAENDISSCPVRVIYSSRYMPTFYHQLARAARSNVTPPGWGFEMTKAPNRIRELRKAAGLTLDALANKIGVAQSTIQRLETGRRTLSEKNIRLISTALNCHPGEIFRPLDESPDEAAQRDAAEMVSMMTPEQRELWLALGRELTGTKAVRKTG